MPTFRYPPAPTGDIEEDRFRSLEDPDDPRTVAWVTAENELTESVLAAVRERETIRTRITELWDYPKSGVPFERGGRWFQTRNTGLQAQSALYVGSSPADEGRVLIDPNELSAEGTVSLTSLGVTEDGALVAYATSSGGSDFLTWRVRSVETGKDLPDVIEWSKFSGAAWTADGTGFFYGAPERLTEGHELRESTSPPRIFFHRLGSSQSTDELVYATEQPDLIPAAGVTDDGRYLVISIQRGTGTETRVLVRDLSVDRTSFTDLVPDLSAKAHVIGNVGTTFYLLTDKGAEKAKVVSVDLEAAGRPWVDLVPEAEPTLVEAFLYGGFLVCHYLQDAHSVLRVFHTEGSWLRDIPLPGLVSLAVDPLGHGSVEGRNGSSVVHFQVVSFAESGALWSHDLVSGATAQVRGSMSKLDSTSFVTEQVFVESDDGTRVPMFLTRLASVTPTGDVPVLLYGYGGFDIAVTPAFSVTFAAWLDRGGLLAVANLRGGGEYGRAWHDAGRLANKQNVFDDLCACARWLATPLPPSAGERAWSQPGRIGISGASNGGLLVGACVTQRPELFGAAVADVGVFDMLRFHLFTIGWAWKSDFGDPDDPTDRGWLLGYSPLHNVRPGTCYPPTLILTGDHDDRVVPGHSYKFAATMQEAQGCDHPVLLRVETSAGHGLGKPTAKLMAEATDRLAFLEVALRRQ